MDSLLSPHVRGRTADCYHVHLAVRRDDRRLSLLGRAGGISDGSQPEASGCKSGIYDNTTRGIYLGTRVCGVYSRSTCPSVIVNTIVLVRGVLSASDLAVVRLIPSPFSSTIAWLSKVLKATSLPARTTV
jgi:hypothetical protein